jgi:hypothetical protein
MVKLGASIFRLGLATFLPHLGHDANWFRLFCLETLWVLGVLGVVDFDFVDF